MRAKAHSRNRGTEGTFAKSGRFVRALGALTAIVALCGATHGQPHSTVTGLRIEPAELDLGTVTDEAPAQGRVWLSNVSGDPIELSVASTSCACTAGILAAATLLPGSGQWLHVTLQTAGRSGPTCQYVTLKAGQVATRLPVRAIVKPLIEIQPRQVELGSMAVGQHTVIRVTGDLSDFQVLSASASHAPVLVEIVRSWERSEAPAIGGRVIELRVTRAEGDLRDGEVLISTNDPRRPLVKIPVISSPNGTPSLPTGVSVLTVVAPSSTATGGTTLPEGVATAGVTSVRDADQPQIPIAWEPGGTEQELLIRLPWDSRVNRRGGLLIVETTGRELRIPYRVRVQPASSAGRSSASAPARR